MANLPQDPRSFIKFLLENHLSSNQPKAKLGGAQGFANAKNVTPKSIASSADELGTLFGKGKPNLNNIKDVVGAGGQSNIMKAISTFAGNPLVKTMAPLAVGAGMQMKGSLDYLNGFKNYWRPEMGDDWNRRQLQIYTDNYTKAHPFMVTPNIVREGMGWDKIPTAKPVAKAQPQLKKVTLPKSNQASPAGLPPLPAIDNVGNMINQLTSVAGLPPDLESIGNTPIQQIANQTLAQKFGLGNYVQPEIAESPLAQERLNQIREYLSRYSPEQYRNVLDEDLRQAQKLRGLDTIFGTSNLQKNVGELDRQAKVLDYLKQGYDVDTNLTQSARALAEADAMSKATGLPASMFADPKDVLTNLIKPQITSQGQIDLAKQYGLNAKTTGAMNNATKLQIAKMISDTAGKRMSSAEQIARIMNSGKIPPALIGAFGNASSMGGELDANALMQLLNAIQNPNVIPSQTNFGDASDNF